MRTQRRMAAEILKVGESRVWIDPEKADEVEMAITREEIRKLIHEKVIRKKPERGISRYRARILSEKKKKGKRRGPGCRSGSENARSPSKEAWMKRIRAQRRRLRELKDKRIITENVYRKLYQIAKSGGFRSVSDIDRYIEAHGLRRRK